MKNHRWRFFGFDTGRQMALSFAVLWGLLLSLLFGNTAWAHSSSNSYLTLSMPAEQLTLRADMHLRDLDLVFDLDENRDGQVTWAETQARRAELLAWMTQGIVLHASGQSCTLGPADLKASLHADGSYLSAVWSPTCAGVTERLDEARLTLRYDLIFAQDNLHRGLLKVDLPNEANSAILSPEQPGAPLVQGSTRLWDTRTGLLLSAPFLPGGIRLSDLPTAPLPVPAWLPDDPAGTKPRATNDLSRPPQPHSASETLSLSSIQMACAVSGTKGSVLPILQDRCPPLKQKTHVGWPIAPNTNDLPTAEIKHL